LEIRKYIRGYFFIIVLDYLILQIRKIVYIQNPLLGKIYKEF